MHRNRLPQAGAEQKKTDDDGALAGPERVGIEILLQVAELVQVKGEMKQRHPDDGRTTQCIQGVEALGWHAANCRGGVFPVDGNAGSHSNVGMPTIFRISSCVGVHSNPTLPRPVKR
jgi:hypothetical protein